ELWCITREQHVREVPQQREREHGENERSMPLLEVLEAVGVLDTDEVDILLRDRSGGFVAHHLSSSRVRAVAHPSRRERATLWDPARRCAGASRSSSAGGGQPATSGDAVTMNER